MKKLSIMGLLLGLVFSVNIYSQETEKKIDKKAYEFTIVKENPHTAVPNQYRSGTCWSFAGIGFVEAEILRETGKSYNLSEMFIVRYAYSDKAKKYVRLHGSLNLGCGGVLNNVMYVIKNYGLIPDDFYRGLVINEEKHVHGEMDEVLKAYTDAVMKNGNRKLTPVWSKGFDALLDTYLGEIPAGFIIDGKSYNPKTFAEATGFNPEMYIDLGSYLDKELHKPFVLEIPDNWNWGFTYNLTLDEMIEVLDNALDDGFTVGWGADVSEKGFSWKNGVAIVPEENLSDLTGTEKEKWEALTAAEKTKSIYSFEEIVKEKNITPEMRQLAYDNYETTDDHSMLIVGKATDQKGNKYYKVKNSWGTDDHIYHGYFFASEAYVKYKTINIFMHKDAVPKQIMKKLGF
jgi:bleomycin hydrolase